MAWAKNIIILVVCLNIVLTIFASEIQVAPDKVGNVADLNKFYTINENTSYSLSQGNGTFFGAIPADKKAAGGSGSILEGWLDPLGFIWDVIKLIFNLAFGIFMIPQSLGLPLVVSLMIFLPLGVAYLLAIDKFNMLYSFPFVITL